MKTSFSKTSAEMKSEFDKDKKEMKDEFKKEKRNMMTGFEKKAEEIRIRTQEEVEARIEAEEQESHPPTAPPP